MPEQNLKRVDISRTLLIHFHANPKNLNHRLVTQDETWVYHFELESKQLEHNGSSSLKKVQASSICWQGDGIFYFIYSEGVIIID